MGHLAQDYYAGIQQLAEQVKEGTYRAKLVLRKYIPKAGGKLRSLRIPVGMMLHCGAIPIRSITERPSLFMESKLLWKAKWVEPKEAAF
jgi:hypothetical protein